MPGLFSNSPVNSRSFLNYRHEDASANSENSSQNDRFDKWEEDQAMNFKSTNAGNGKEDPLNDFFDEEETIHEEVVPEEDDGGGRYNVYDHLHNSNGNNSADPPADLDHSENYTNDPVPLFGASTTSAFGNGSTHHERTYDAQPTTTQTSNVLDSSESSESVDSNTNTDSHRENDDHEVDDLEQPREKFADDGDEEERNVNDNEKDDKKDNRSTCAKIFNCYTLLTFLLGIGVGYLLFWALDKYWLGDDDDNENEARVETLAPTPAVTTTPVAATLAPTAGGDIFVPPIDANSTLAPTSLNETDSNATETLPPNATLAPTTTNTTPACFATTAELRQALRLYYADNDDATQRLTVTTQYGPSIADWCIGQLTDLSNLFVGGGEAGLAAAAVFDEPIGNWDVSQVTTLQGTFDLCKVFNQDLSAWNTSLVTNMEGTFNRARAFDQSLASWDTSRVTTMRNMFRQAQSFNHPTGLESWNVARVTDFTEMFQGAETWNQPLNAWDIGGDNLEGDADFSMASMFRGATAFNQDLDSWNMGRVTTLAYMFFNATSFNGNVDNWDIRSVNNLKLTFDLASSFNRDISGWDISQVTDMDFIFGDAASFNQNLANWDVSKVRFMNFAFYNATSFSQNLCSWGNQTFATDPTTLNMFVQSACPVTSDPNFADTPPGPLCFPCDGR